MIASEEETYEVMMKLSTGQLTKNVLVSLLKANSEPVIE